MRTTKAAAYLLEREATLQDEVREQELVLARLQVELKVVRETRAKLAEAPKRTRKNRVPPDGAPTTTAA